MVSGFPYYNNRNYNPRSMYTWADFYHLFGIKTQEDLAASDPNKGKTAKDFKQIPDDPTDKVDELEGINPLGVAIDRNQRNQAPVDCSHECGSFFMPTEWGCYWDKYSGKCGGSTGLCDAFGAGELCTNYAKYAVVLVAIVVGAIVVQKVIK